MESIYDPINSRERLKPGVNPMLDKKSSDEDIDIELFAAGGGISEKSNVSGNKDILPPRTIREPFARDECDDDNVDEDDFAELSNTHGLTLRNNYKVQCIAFDKF
jgi:hypothetical protein